MNYTQNLGPPILHVLLAIVCFAGSGGCGEFEALESDEVLEE